MCPWAFMGLAMREVEPGNIARPRSGIGLLENMTSSNLTVCSLGCRWRRDAEGAADEMSYAITAEQI